ncbi:MAG: hypothetical protein QM749_02145 [Aquabacterium sp.]
MDVFIAARSSFWWDPSRQNAMKRVTENHTAFTQPITHANGPTGKNGFLGH